MKLKLRSLELGKKIKSFCTCCEVGYGYILLGTFLVLPNIPVIILFSHIIKTYIHKLLPSLEEIEILLNLRIHSVFSIFLSVNVGALEIEKKIVKII